LVAILVTVWLLLGDFITDTDKKKAGDGFGVEAGLFGQQQPANNVSKQTPGKA
jgi:hypothetical protein